MGISLFWMDTGVGSLREEEMANVEEMFRQILHSAPSRGTLHAVLSRMKEEGRHREVIRESLKALGARPDDIRLRQLLAESYLETGFIGLAEDELDRMTTDLHPLLAVYKLQARLYAKQNRREEALEALKRYRVHHPDDPEALDLWRQMQPEGMPPSDALGGMPVALATPTLAEIYSKQGRLQDAIRTYEQVLRDAPENEAATKRLAELKAETGRRGPGKAAGLTDTEIRVRKEKVVGILEKWLSKVKELDEI
jgi:tetratricopeptide (TPR) repeat protein